jgi:hypothetical protein
MSAAKANSSACAIMRHLSRLIAQGFAPARNGSVAVAGDIATAMELLAAGRPGGSAIVIFYDSDLAAGDEGMDEDTLVDGAISVGVTRRQGLAAKPDPDALGALEEAEALRTFLARQIAEGSLTGLYGYAGMKSLATREGVPLHGYALTWKVLYAYEI